MKKTYIYASVAIFFWSTVATVTKLLLGTLNNVQLLWISSLFAGLSMLLINICAGKMKEVRKYTLKDYIVSALIGLPGTFLYYIFYYKGADMLFASQAFIINYLWPIMCVVFACILLKEKLTIKKTAAIMISFSGVGVATFSGTMKIDLNTLIGALCCILGAVSYGAFTALNRKMNYDKDISMMISYGVTFVITGIMNFMDNNLFLPDFFQLSGIMYNGIFTMAIANMMWIKALSTGKTAKVSNLAYITPFISLVWTALILKEKITVNSILGLMIIIAGILLQLLPEKEKGR